MNKTRIKTDIFSIIFTLLQKIKKFIRKIYPQFLSAKSIRNICPQNLSAKFIRKIYPQFLSAKSSRKIYPQNLSAIFIRKIYLQNLSAKSIRNPYPHFPPDPNCIKCMCMASNFTNCRVESFLGLQFCTRSRFWHICHVKRHGHFTLIQAILPLVSETRDNSRSILTTSVLTSL